MLFGVQTARKPPAQHIRENRHGKDLTLVFYLPLFYFKHFIIQFNSVDFKTRILSNY